jgi:hypothetical protein
MRLKPFTRQELWQAIRDYLCGETIAGDGHFVMHGSYPAAVVSMFVPPPGLVIQRHIRSQDKTDVAPLAGLLHTMGISFYHDAAIGAAFKQHTLSAWVRVPVKHFLNLLQPFSC